MRWQRCFVGQRIEAGAEHHIAFTALNWLYKPWHFFGVIAVIAVKENDDIDWVRRKVSETLEHNVAVTWQWLL